MQLDACTPATTVCVNGDTCKYGMHALPSVARIAFLLAKKSKRK